MNQKIFSALVYIIISTLVIDNYATQLVLGPANTSTTTFTQTATQAVYSPGAATWYVGLAAADTSGSSIYGASRPIGTAKPIFSPLGGGAITAGIIFLTLATNYGNAMPYLGFVDNLATTTVKATRYDGSRLGDTALVDAAGAPAGDVFALAGMLLAQSTNKGFLFAAVSPTETPTFGGPDSGIAVVSLNDNPNSSATIMLDQTAADSSSPGVIKAKELDASTPEVLINAEPTLASFATMHWDGQLQRLYTGLQLATSEGPDNGAKSVVVAQVQNNGTLILYNILQESALTPGDTDAIIAIINGSSNSNSLAVNFLRTMHCSTGPTYLIVNGGVGTVVETGDLVYALPLVNICPDSPFQGTIANKNSTLSYNNAFTIPAANPGDLPLSTDPATQVGAGPLPIQPSTAISDIQVIGDTVYVSILSQQTTLDDNGIFYSEALFDATGKISHWTPWTKRAFPFNGFDETPATINEGVRFFAVDAVTGKVWAIDGATQKVAKVTAWDNGGQCTTRTAPCTPGATTVPSVCCTLAAQLCANMSCGCYSVLDLDQGTRGFTALQENPCCLNRFALFGGCGQVDFACVSVAYNPIITSPQQVIEDFCPTCSVNNFLPTYLPDRSVCVNVLEYSRADASNDDQCYFFAGTDDGLYVYAFYDTRQSTTGGFLLDDLSIDTLSHGVWIKIPEFPEPIIDIKTTGLSLYILTRSVPEMESTLFRVDFASTLTEMFNENNVYTLAQTGTGPFAQSPAFTGIQPVAVQVLGDTIQAEQLLLATNNGLYGSNAAGTHGIASAEDQTDAHWQRIPNNNKTWFEGIAGIDTPIPTTAWPISVKDLYGALSFQNSWIHQISNSITNNPSPFISNFQPTFFNAIVRNAAFEAIDPITYFWSDGARRFFIINRTQDPATINKLMSFPFNTITWRVCAPGQEILLFDPYVVATKRFFWVKQIGATGILMAGTDTGVIALE